MPHSLHVFDHYEIVTSEHFVILSGRTKSRLERAHESSNAQDTNTHSTHQHTPQHINSIWCGIRRWGCEVEVIKPQTTMLCYDLWTPRVHFPNPDWIPATLVLCLYYVVASVVARHVPLPSSLNCTHRKRFISFPTRPAPPKTWNIYQKKCLWRKNINSKSRKFKLRNTMGLHRKTKNVPTEN